jgi:Spy/CpxP family protein refolding chaperone
LSSTRFLAAAVLAASLLVPAGAFAQQAPPAPVPGAPAMSGHHRGHHGGWRRMLQTLNLSAAQKQQVDAAFAQSKSANKGVTDPATRKANRDKLHAQIESILTPDQRTQLQSQMQKARQRHREGMPGPAPTGAPHN